MSRNARTIFYPLANVNPALAQQGELFIDITDPNRPVLFWKDATGTLRNLSEPTAVAQVLPTTFAQGITVGGVADFVNATETRLGTVKLNAQKVFDAANARLKNFPNPIADDNPVNLGYMKTFINNSRKEVVIPMAQFTSVGGRMTKTVSFSQIFTDSVFFVQLFSPTGLAITNEFEIIVDNSSKVITIQTPTLVTDVTLHAA